MRERWLRAGIALLAAAFGAVGFWAQLAPQSFYDDFPGGGGTWVSALPPYNEHLVRDVGGLNLALVLLLIPRLVSRFTPTTPDASAKRRRRMRSGG